MTCGARVGVGMCTDNIRGARGAGGACGARTTSRVTARFDRARRPGESSPGESAPGESALSRFRGDRGSTRDTCTCLERGI